MAGIDAGSHKTDTLLPLKDRIVHGKDHAAGTGRLHDPQICQLPPGQDGILKGFQGISRPGGHTDGSLGCMCQHMGGRGGDVKPLKHPLDSGKILRIFLGPFQQRRVIGVPEQVTDLTAQGKSRHIFLCGKHILVDYGGSGLHGIRHLVGNITFYHMGGIGGHHQPEQQHPCQGDNGCYSPDPGGKFFVFNESHKRSPHLKKNFRADSLIII